MKKIFSKLMLSFILIGLFGCNSIVDNSQYEVNSIITYGSLYDADKIEVTYKIKIYRLKEDIINIKDCQLNKLPRVKTRGIQTPCLAMYHNAKYICSYSVSCLPWFFTYSFITVSF